LIFPFRSCRLEAFVQSIWKKIQNSMADYTRL
jgi:hypothetical protein